MVELARSEPRLLILDTSSKGGVVALAQGDTILGEERLDDSRRHARDLTPAVDRLVRQQGWRPRELEGVIVSIGPGSYTGLRVGLMAAKTLAYASGCALLGVETFAAIAGQASAGVALVDVLADAQQERIYVQSFHREGEDWLSLAPLRITELSAWLASRDPAAHVSGPGVESFADRLSRLPLVDAALRVPTASGLLRIGLRRYRAGERDSHWNLEPIYLRPSSAEEQWQRLAHPRPEA